MSKLVEKSSKNWSFNEVTVRFSAHVGPFKPQFMSWRSLSSHFHHSGLILGD